MTNYSKLTNAEIDRRIAELVFTHEGDLVIDAFVYCGPDPISFRPFSTDYNAAHAAWAKLTDQQKCEVIRLTGGENMYVAGLRLRDATPRDLCIWMLHAVEKAQL